MGRWDNWSPRTAILARAGSWQDLQPVWRCVTPVRDSRNSEPSQPNRWIR